MRRRVGSEKGEDEEKGGEEEERNNLQFFHRALVHVRCLFRPEHWCVSALNTKLSPSNSH